MLDSAWVLILGWLVALVFIHGLGLRITIISGTSMRPTFSDGQIVAAQTIGASAKFDRGDVITFFPYEDSGITYIKRIIGLPGETIQSSGDIVFIDGKELESIGGTGTWGPVVIPDDAVFVMGDNRASSCDSRMIGCISFSQINTRVIEKEFLLS